MAESAWRDWEPVAEFDNPSVLYFMRYRERGGGIAKISINRTERMNAINGDVSEGVLAAIEDANEDGGLGAIVITHEGLHFGVGGDLTGAGNLQTIGAIDATIKACRKPVIAAVRGYCIGASNHMAYTCDFTVAGESTIFGQNGPRIGSPAAGYVVASSAHVIGQKRARELWMRCRQLTAQEGLQAGLCNVVVQDRLVEREVLRFCDDVLDLVPTCINRVKRSFESVDRDLQDTDAYLTADYAYTPGPDIREGGMAFFEKRDPNHWTDDLIAARAKAREG